MNYFMKFNKNTDIKAPSSITNLSSRGVNDEVISLDLFIKGDCRTSPPTGGFVRNDYNILRITTFAFLLLIQLMIFIGCNEPADPPVHPDDWPIPGSEYSHVAKIAESGILGCKTCHSDDETKEYDGGSSGVSCYECHEGGPSGHPNIVAWTSPDSSDYHGRIFWENGWDFSDCRKCHGNDFAGGVVGFSCNNCHMSGIGSSTTCHGDPETNLAYPPKDILNHTDSTLISIGAHQAHMESELTNVSCGECHNVPGNYLDEGHLGADNIAEVEFGVIATDSSALSPTWTRSLATCENVYCHGAFSFSYEDSLITGNYTSAVWTAPGSVPCGTCHGLPPNGHEGAWTPEQCFYCHGTVIDENGNIIDKTKHINGQINLN